MKRGLTKKIKEILKEVGFDDDCVLIITESLKIADNKGLDPFNFSLKYSILKPLEERLPFTYSAMRKMIERDVNGNWSSHIEKYKELGFKNKPTVKGLISLGMLKIKEA